MSAPERIALRWEPGAAVTSGPLMQHPEYTPYTRADLAAEAEARARLDGWNAAIEAADGLRDIVADTIGARPLSSIHSALCEFSNRIRALRKDTP